MRVQYHVTRESKDAVDIIGVLDDGRVFWAWGPTIPTDELDEFVRRYVDNPQANTAEQGAAVYETVEDLREELEAVDLQDMVKLTKEPVIVVEGGVGLGSRWKKRATLAECVEMVQAKRGE